MLMLSAFGSQRVLYQQDFENVVSPKQPAGLSVETP